jgi:hypothetical protein
MNRARSVNASSLLLAAAILCLASPAWSMRPTEVAPCRPNMPQEVRSFPGVFTVHVVCDHVLFEIPPTLLGRDMLLNTEFSALSAGVEKLAPGAVVDSRVVRWVRRGNKVFLENVRYEMRAENGSGLDRGVESTQLNTVLIVLEAVAEGKEGAPIIDVTSMYTDTPKGFAMEFKQYFKMSTNDPKRSYIDSVKVFPQNIEVGFHQTWIPDQKDLEASYKPGNTPIPAALGFSFHTSMLLLPEKPMTGRYSDPRVGYFEVEFRDYGTMRNRGVNRGFITRYRLEKKDPAAPLSDPVKPIVFYISHEVPEKWRPYLKRGIEAWQGPFEKAGFRKAIVARDAPTPEQDPGWDPEDVRFSVIRWTPSPRENAMGPAVVDPRSGEVLSSHAIFWHDILRLAETWYFTQVGPLDPRAKKLPLPDEVMGEVLSYVTTHEVGHALGLRHNFKAHSAVSVEQLRSAEWTQRWGTSTSIMSYARFNYVAQPGDKVGLVPRFGPYDFFAIDWGYRQFGHNDMGCDDEWPVLDALAASQLENRQIQFGGEDAVAPLDPSVNTNVLGSDPIAAADLGLKNVDRTAAMLVGATTELGRDYALLAEMYYALVQQRHRELAAVAKLVGGVEETRYQGGRGGIPFKPVEPGRQREAVRFLIDRAFATPTVLLDKEILWRIGPTGGEDAVQGANVRLLQMLIQPTVFVRMVEAAQMRTSGKAYMGLDLLEDLNKGMFAELEQGVPKIDPFRRQLQRNYVTVLLVAAGEAEDPEAASSAITRDIDADARRYDGEAVRVRAQQRQFVYAYSSLAEAGQQFKVHPRRASEMRAAVRWAVEDMVERIDAAMKKKLDDPETWAHLRDLRAELSRAF